MTDEATTKDPKWATEEHNEVLRAAGTTIAHLTQCVKELRAGLQEAVLLADSPHMSSHDWNQAMNRLSSLAAVPGCSFNHVSSRTCERGSKGCETRHEMGHEKWERIPGVLGREKDGCVNTGASRNFCPETFRVEDGFSFSCDGDLGHKGLHHDVQFDPELDCFRRMEWSTERVLMSTIRLSDIFRELASYGGQGVVSHVASLSSHFGISREEASQCCQELIKLKFIEAHPDDKGCYEVTSAGRVLINAGVSELTRQIEAAQRKDK